MLHRAFSAGDDFQCTTVFSHSKNFFFSFIFYQSHFTFHQTTCASFLRPFKSRCIVSKITARSSKYCARYDRNVKKIFSETHSHHGRRHSDTIAINENRARVAFIQITICLFNVYHSHFSSSSAHRFCGPLSVVNDDFVDEKK